MKPLTTLVVLAIVVGVAYFGVWPWLSTQSSVQNLGLSGGKAAQAQAFDNTYAPQFLTYTDDQFGFQVNYPIGYAASNDVNTATQTSSFMLLVPRRTGDAESLVLRAYLPDAGETPETTLADFRSELGVSDLRENHVKIHGADAITFDSYDAIEQSGLQTDATLSVAIYSCPAHGDAPAYLALFTARTPADLPADLDMVNYLEYSFKCNKDAPA